MNDQTINPSWLLPSPEPWEAPVSGEGLLADLIKAIEDHVALPEHASLGIALWVLHTYSFDAFLNSPRLAIISPEKQCGKTTLLCLLQELVQRPLPSANVTMSVVFRAIDRYRPTLLIDEADTFLSGKEDLRGILNSGHSKRMAHVLRAVGEDNEPVRFTTWAPVAIAAIKNIPDTLMDRSVIIRMRRRLPEETVLPMRGKALERLLDLARQMMRWSADQQERLAQADPDMPEGLSDRACDNWRPLIALADAAGGQWPELARAAAVALCKRTDEDDISPGEQVLADMLAFMAEQDCDRVSSDEIVDALLAREDRPWNEYRNGNPLTPHGLAAMLKPFGIGPKKFRFGKETLSGYDIGPVSNAARRYCRAGLQKIGTSEPPASH